MNEVIEEKLQLLPERPGVYLMKDKAGVIIYVGKAVILKNRVRQYFQNNHSMLPRLGQWWSGLRILKSSLLALR